MIVLRRIAFALGVIALTWAMVIVVTYVTFWLAERIVNG